MIKFITYSNINYEELKMFSGHAKMESMKMKTCHGRTLQRKV